MADATEIPPLARALGRIPTGLYIVTTKVAETPMGFVGSFVMQVGFDPPTMCVAVGKERGHLASIRSAGRFALSVLDGSSSGLMGPFFKAYDEGESPFDELQVRATPTGLPVLADALCWLDCRLSGEHETGDHVVLFGVVESAEAMREGDPSIHLRKNGLGY